MISKSAEGVYQYHSQSKSIKLYPGESFVHNPKAKYIVYDQNFPFYCIDVKLAAKILEWDHPSSLNHLSIRFLHKALNKNKFTGCNAEKRYYEGIQRIWVKIAAELTKRDMYRYFEFEMSVKTRFYKFQKPKLKVRSDILNVEIDAANSFVSKFDKKEFTKSKVEEYVNHHFRSTYDLQNSKVDLSHKKLASYNDAFLDSYIKMQKSQAIIHNKSQYYSEDGIITCDYITMGSITGRIQSERCNIQGLPLKYYSNNFYSLDFKSQELYGYLMLEKPAVYQYFKQSGLSDFYHFMYNYVSNKPPISEEEFVNKEGARDNMKNILIGLMNGRKIKSMVDHISGYGKKYPVNAILRIVDDVYKAMEFDKCRKKLVNHIASQGCYLSIENKLFNRKIFTADSITFRRLNFEVLGYIKMHGRDPSKYPPSCEVTIEEFKKYRYIVKSKMMSHYVQAACSAAYKLGILRIIKEIENPNILSFRHDQIILDASEEQRVDLYKEKLEQASVSFFGDVIPIKIEYNKS